MSNRVGAFAIGLYVGLVVKPLYHLYMINYGGPHRYYADIPDSKLSEEIYDRRKEWENKHWERMDWVVKEDWIFKEED